MYILRYPLNGLIWMRYHGHFNEFDCINIIRNRTFFDHISGSLGLVVSQKHRLRLEKIRTREKSAKLQHFSQDFTRNNKLAFLPRGLRVLDSNLSTKLLVTPGVSNQNGQRMFTNVEIIVENAVAKWLPKKQCYKTYS